MRSSSIRSLRTQAELGRTRNRSDFERATGANMLSILDSTGSIGNAVTVGSIAPASSLEMSSSVLNSSFMPETAAPT